MPCSNCENPHNTEFGHSFSFTGTMVESHLGCWIGLMNLASSSFLTSGVIWTSMSVWKTLVGWTTSLTPESTLREWTTSPRSKPGISSYVHANTSTYLLSNATNCSFSFVVNWLLMKIGFGDPRPAPKFTFSNSSSGWIYASLSGSSRISSWAIMQSDNLGPSYTTHLGPAYLRKWYISLPPGFRTTTHSQDIKELVSFFCLFLSRRFLRLWVPPSFFFF